jgi:putative addiction module CopG family antidote
MQTLIPSDLQQFVDEELATGGYKSESELVIQALRVYRELKTRHDALRRDVELSVQQAERGEISLLDTAATKRAARARLAAQD